MAVKNSFFNMTACLVCITLVCSSLLAGVFVLTKSPIEQAEQNAKQEAVKKVSPAFASLEEIAACDEAPAYVKTLGEAGEVVAYVVDGSSAKGFGGKLTLKVGFTSDGKIYRTTVLSHSETPGLGAKCQSDSTFIKQFEGRQIAKMDVKKDGGDVDAITASTITSRAYCDALNNAIANFEAIPEVKVMLAAKAKAEVAETAETVQEQEESEQTENTNVAEEGTQNE